MSGGGGYLGLVPVGSAPAPYQWFQGGTRRSSTTIDLNNAELAFNVVFVLITANVSPPVAVATGLANAVAQYCINANVEEIYYTQTLFELEMNMMDGVSDESLWHPVGNAKKLWMYSDSSRTQLIEYSITSDLDSDKSYLMDYLP